MAYQSAHRGQSVSTYRCCGDSVVVGRAAQIEIASAAGGHWIRYLSWGWAWMAAAALATLALQTDVQGQQASPSDAQILYGDGSWITDELDTGAEIGGQIGGQGVDQRFEFGPRFTESLFDNLANGITGEPCGCADCDTYHFEFLPRDNLYPFYLADMKQSRMSGHWIEASNDNTLLDGTLGGRFGIFRYVNGNSGPYRRGVQLDVESSAQIRLDMTEEHDVRSVDFRAGIPLSFSFGRLHTRIGYYHISSHVGDEFLIKNPGFDRLNYVRDALLFGAGYWLNDSARVYGEATWAFHADVAEPWEFIFGIEDAPRRPTGLRGAPFYAINGRLREEVNYGGAVTAQVGWAWRSSYDSGLLRAGLHYFNGLSDQWSFYNDHEELVGLGFWYDF